MRRARSARDDTTCTMQAACGVRRTRWHMVSPNGVADGVVDGVVVRNPRFVVLGIVVVLVGGLGLFAVRAAPSLGMNILAKDPVPRAARTFVAGNASPIGTNLGGISDYSTEVAFVDVFKMSRPWISTHEGVWADDKPLDVDARGWIKSLAPGQWARTLMLWEGVPAPAGAYTVLWEGQGKMALDAPVLSSSTDGAVKSTVIQIDPMKSGILLTITETSPSDPIRNIKVIGPPVCADEPTRVCGAGLPACATGACIDFVALGDARPVFHPAFVAQTKPFGVLRFMDWWDTNNSKVITWSDRPLPEDARYTSRGVPVETSVALSELVGADPWITIPDQADDAYVRALATYMRDHVAKDRRIYVELSNEVWNGMFPQARRATERGKKLGMRGNEYEQGLRAYARRVVEVMKIFEEAFSAQGAQRIVRVMGSQNTSVYASQVVLAEEDAYLHIDALAIAPYIGGPFGAPDQTKKTAARSVDDLLDEMLATQVQQVRRWVEDQKKVANKFGVDLIAYEGGQHLQAIGPMQDDAAINERFDAMNRSPRMGAVYDAYLRAWKEGGGTLFVHFTDTSEYNKWGRWGAREYVGQPRAQAPKADALLRFIEQTPRWW
jgi:hypothetical protein